MVHGIPHGGTMVQWFKSGFSAANIVFAPTFGKKRLFFAPTFGFGSILDKFCYFLPLLLDFFVSLPL